MVGAKVEEASCSSGDGVTMGEVIGLHCDGFPVHTILLCVEEEGDGVCAEESGRWCREGEDPEVVPKLHVLHAELDSVSVVRFLRVLTGS